MATYRKSDANTPVPKVNAVLKMMAKTATGASFITAWTIHMHASNTCSSSRINTFSCLCFGAMALIATPKMSAKIISCSMSPSSARTAVSIGLRGISSTIVSATDFAAGGLGLNASGHFVAAVI